MSSFSERLKYAMNLKCMRNVDLAAATGIHHSSITNWLTGKYIPKADKVKILADALGCDYFWLVGLDPMVKMVDDYFSNKLIIKQKKDEYGLLTLSESNEDVLKMIQKCSYNKFDLILKVLKKFTETDTKKVLNMIDIFVQK